MNLVPLLDLGLLRFFYFFLHPFCGFCYFVPFIEFLFHLSYCVCCHTIITYSLIGFLISVGSKVMSPLWFLILRIYIYIYIFLLDQLYQDSWIFSISQILVLLFFSIVYLFYISWIPTLKFLPFHLL